MAPSNTCRAPAGCCAAADAMAKNSNDAKIHSRKCECMAASLRRLGNRSREIAPDKIKTGARTKHERSHKNGFASIAAELRTAGVRIRNQRPAGQGSRSDPAGDP